MLIRQKAAVSLLAAGALLLSGCEMLVKVQPVEEVWAPTKSSAISIGEDGTFTELLNDTLDQSYYSASELEQMINSEITAYNKAHGEGAITLSSFTTEGANVAVQLTYATPEDYASFNNTEFFCGTMIDAQLAGYLFDTTFNKVKDGSISKEDITEKELYKEIDEKVVVVRGPVEVHTPGKILMASTNTDILSADSAYATGISSVKQVEDLILPSNEVYRRSEKVSFERQQTEKRSYIVYKDVR